MSEVEALARHACPACGAQAEWSPAQQKLVCAFCGTEAPYRVDAATGRVEELDLVRALRELPDEARGWQAEKRSVQCRSCKAVSVFDAVRVGQNCDFCGSTALVDYREIKAPIRPQGLLPFRVGAGQVREAVKRWLGGHWLAPGALKRRGLVDTLRGIYVPYWTFDAQAHCPWSAEAGHYYYTTETYRDSNGRTQTRRVRHVRWEPASGVVDRFFDDEPIPGTKGLDRGLLKGIEPFPTADVVPYDTSYLAGFVVEHYQVVLLDAARASQASMTEQLRRSCSDAVPGDTQRGLEIRPAFSGQTFKHVLLPVWLLHYNFGSRVFQVLINGVTGKIAGKTPVSPWKVLLLVVALALFAWLMVSYGLAKMAVE